MQNQELLSDHRFVRVFSGHGFGYSLICIFKHVGNKKSAPCSALFYCGVYQHLRQSGLKVRVIELANNIQRAIGT